MQAKLIPQEIIGIIEIKLADFLLESIFILGKLY